MPFSLPQDPLVEKAPARWGWRVFALALLAVIPIIGHGCHSDEDNELRDQRDVSSSVP